MIITLNVYKKSNTKTHIIVLQESKHIKQIKMTLMEKKSRKTNFNEKKDIFMRNSDKILVPERFQGFHRRGEKSKDQIAMVESG